MSCLIRAPRPLVITVAFIVGFGLKTTLVSQRRAPSRRTVLVDGHEAVSGEALVRFANVVRTMDRVQLEQQLDAEETEPVASDLRRIRSRTLDAHELVAFLRTQPDVLYAEPNYIVHAVRTPNDSKFGSLWGLLNKGQTIGGQRGVTGADIHATAAWSISTGSRANVVGVVDTGVDYKHPDLFANMWRAPTSFSVTIGGVKMTCVAGTRGYNAIARTCDPRDDNFHGTHVAGTIGAAGNNTTGVSGVNWTTSIMALKFLDADGSGTTADAINAIEFAIQAKHAFAASSGANVRVLSNSWAGGGYSRALLDEINKANANNMLFVAAAGNNASDNSRSPSYPASYRAPNVIAVAASDNQDQLAAFSNYGSSVHLAAPGVNILSTAPGNTYRTLSGTSMATPHVSGAAALYLSKCSATTSGVKAALLNSVDKVGALTGWVSTNGRLNVARALSTCTKATSSSTRPAAPAGVVARSGPSAARVTLSWKASTGADLYRIKRSRTSGGPYTVVSSVRTHDYVDTGTSGRRYYYVLTALNESGQSPNSAQVTAVAR